MSKKKTIKLFYEAVKDGVYQSGFIELTEEEFEKLLKGA